jgi:pimeloyl-ACP methyl ester carboxylesterase
VADQPYAERRFTAQDGRVLYYRDYGDAVEPATPILCLAGLTRNAKDFHDFALRHAAQRRVLALDLRGRGMSERDSDWRNYQAPTYIRDIQHLLAAADAHRVIVVGTSLGGILAMVMAVAQPTAVAAAVLNDIGPEIDPAGAARIEAYAGQTVQLDDWQAAKARLKELFGAAWPDISEQRWDSLTRQSYREGPDGGPELDYDTAISRPFQEPENRNQDLWPFFRALEQIPTLAIRGALSDIFSQQTLARMAEEKPDLEQVVVPNRGHVPLLDEPDCAAALDAFIARY